MIHIAEDRVADPLAGGECPGNGGYREMRPAASLRTNMIKKLDPKWVQQKAGRLKWIAITCRDLDFIVLVVLPDGALGYVSEGEIAYRLVKKQR